MADRSKVPVSRIEGLEERLKDVSGFDFEGTKAEFDAAVTAGTITDDSVSLITDDVSGDTVATKAELAVVENNANNLTNLTASGKNKIKTSISNYAIRFPDFTKFTVLHENVTVQNQTFTAPTDGYISWVWYAKDDLNLTKTGDVDTPGKGLILTINDVRVSDIASWSAYAHYFTSPFLIPVKKGDVCKYTCVLGHMYFYEMLGAN